MEPKDKDSKNPNDIIKEENGVLVRRDGIKVVKTNDLSAEERTRMSHQVGKSHIGKTIRKW